MKKGIVTIVVAIILILITGTVPSLAVSNTNIEMNIQGQTTVNSTDDTVELTISLGNFTGIEEGQPLGYQGTITYDENVFEGITVEGLNGWTVNYENSTKVFMGEIDLASANTEIAKITLTLKDGLTLPTTGKIQFNNILLTDGTNDYTFNKEVTITVEENTEVNDEENVIEEETTNTTNVNNTNTSIQANKVDTTVSKQTLPAAGIKNIMIISIVAIIVLAIIFKIKSRKIKY